MVCTLPVSSWSASPASITPPGTRIVGWWCCDASAIIIAGNPLSQVAMPITPARVGWLRIKRRMTWLESLRYGRLSNMPTVPCVRPSHGSVTAPANGRHRNRANSSAAAFTSNPTSQCPEWKPSATGVPSSARRPPCVLRMVNSLPPSSAGLHPMPTFCVQPKRSPLGAWRRRSSVSGSAPFGPLAVVTSS